MVQRSIDNKYLPFASYYGIKLSHYFLTIGVIGLNEMCLNYCDSPLSKNVAFIHKVLTFMRKKLAEFQEETGYLFFIFNILSPCKGFTASYPSLLSRQ